jgi:hypothetical protein
MSTTTENSADAMRRLAMAIRMVHAVAVDRKDEYEGCDDLIGDTMLIDALAYLSAGEVVMSKHIMMTYAEWQETGIASWPYHTGEPSDGP